MREHGLFLSGKIKTGVVDTPHHYHTGYEIILVEDGEIFARCSGFQPEEILELWMDAKIEERKAAKK